ncbi:MAG: SH3 domain-containing protein [Flavobacteriales bacterium]|nr:SH3 domain-containing protein [Flavobacteriales bacterium]
MKTLITALCMALSGITTMLAQTAPAPVVGEVYEAVAELNLREGPGTQFKVIGMLVKGTKVELVRAQGDWWIVKSPGAIGDDGEDSYPGFIPPPDAIAVYSNSSHSQFQGFVSAKYLRANDLAGWEPKSYHTGATPDCENVTPRYDWALDNFLRVVVGNNTDVVVKLMKIGAYSDECIRIVYVRAGDTYEMKHIPEGRYYLKIAYGRDYRQRVVNGQCKVRFVRDAIYEKGTDILDFNKQYVPGGWQEPSFELSLNVIKTLYDSNAFDAGTISEEEFNK